MKTRFFFQTDKNDSLARVFTDLKQTRYCEYDFCIYGYFRHNYGMQLFVGKFHFHLVLKRSGNQASTITKKRKAEEEFFSKDFLVFYSPPT